MATIATPLPIRRSDLVIRPSGDKGEHVVKDPRTGEYFNLGIHESFLLWRLDGRHTAAAICAEFERRYREPLAPDELEGFLELARGSSLVREVRAPTEQKPPGAPPIASSPRPAPATSKSPAATARLATASPKPTPPASKAPADKITPATETPRTAAASPPATAAKPEAPAKAKQSILYWRKSFFDPDALFNWMEPKLRFFWSRTFLVVSAIAIGAAGVMVWANRHELVARFSDAWGWQTLFLAWLALALSTTLHEFAHGLTCKHYGGEVHEVGFLALFFTPCFYCNVSDAWLFREKSKRLWVTFAGGYWDLVMWASAAFVWRLTAQDTAINYLAWVVLSICAARVFFNFNPLLKLDGYYLLSDWTAIPNLRQRGLDRAMATLRWLLWGAPRPGAEPRSRFLLWFGLAAWLYSLVFVSVMLFALMRWANGRWGAAGVVCTAALSLLVMRGLMQGTTSGEVGKMALSRRGRTAVWLLLLCAAASALCFVRVIEQARGGFVVRPAARSEIHAPAAGFLQEICCEEGQRVEAGQVLARLEIPDLSSKIAQKRAEAAELDTTIAYLREEVQHARSEVHSPSAAQYREANRSGRAYASQLEQSAAKLLRVKEELAYLERLSRRTVIRSPIAGTAVTPRLKEKKGHYVSEGQPVCVIEESTALEAEVKLPEQEVAKVRAGQVVEFKARALPFETFKGTVLARAALAAPGEVHGTVTVYCRIDAPPAGLGSGMSGVARIQCGPQSAGAAATKRVLRFLRTEFWW